MMSKLLGVLLFCLVLSQAQIQPIDFQSFYGVCCGTHYVFSVDISGSMYPWISALDTITSDWKAWLVNQRNNGQNYMVSAHTFDHPTWGNNGYVYNTGMIYKAPSSWLPTSPPHSPGGGTDWDLAIEFLTDRMNMNIRDNICYSLITDTDNPYLNNATIITAFEQAYQRWKRYGCQMVVRVFDVRGMPWYQRQALTKQQGEQQSTRVAFRYIKDLIQGVGAYYQVIEIRDVRQFSQYYRCPFKGFISRT